MDGKLGKLGDNIKVSNDDRKVSVDTNVNFSKRYLKYLTKKYLKKHSLREFLYVVASDKKNYQIKYFNIQQEEQEEWSTCIHIHLISIISYFISY